MSQHFRTCLFLLTFTVLYTVFYMYSPMILPYLTHYHVLARNNCCRRSAVHAYTFSCTQNLRLDVRPSKLKRNNTILRDTSSRGKLKDPPRVSRFEPNKSGTHLVLLIVLVHCRNERNTLSAHPPELITDA